MSDGGNSKMESTIADRLVERYRAELHDSENRLDAARAFNASVNGTQLADAHKALAAAETKANIGFDALEKTRGNNGHDDR
jgi:hypothetical protein